MSVVQLKYWGVRFTLPNLRAGRKSRIRKELVEAVLKEAGEAE